MDTKDFMRMPEYPLRLLRWVPGERNEKSYEEIQLTEEQAKELKNLPKLDSIPERLPEADPSTLR